MSPSPDGPYKSKLFNYIHKQYIRVKDRSQKTLLNLKIGLEIGLQVILYPIYLIVQATRLVDRQLQQRRQQSSLKQASTAYNANSLERVAITIDTKEIVLVDQENQPVTIDIKKQRDIQKQIVWLLTTYSQEQRIFKELDNQPSPLYLPPIPNNNPNLVPPVALFRRLMAWVQTGPVATAINLFEENSLAPKPASNDVIIRLDTTVATLETQSPHSFFTNLIQLAYTYFANKRTTSILPPTEQLAKRASSAVSNLEDLGSSIKSAILVQSQSSRVNPFQLQALIYAAIAYFLQQSSPPRRLKSYTPPLSPEDDPWLSWTDLYQPTQDNKTTKTIQGQQPLKTLPKGNIPPVQDPWLEINVVEEVITTEHQPTPPTEKIPQLPQTQTIITTEELSPEEVKDWLEVEATNIGYEKHLLEKILQWLDRTIYWLEVKFASLWRLLQRKIF